jgi:hypothetical protein
MQLADVSSYQPVRRKLNPGALLQLRSRIPTDAFSGMAAVYVPGDGYVLLGGEHRYASAAQWGDGHAVFYVLRTWTDFVAWMIEDLRLAETLGYQAVQWDEVAAANLYRKAVRLLNPGRNEKTGRDIAEYTGTNVTSAGSIRWAIELAEAADPELRAFIQTELKLIEEGLLKGHSIRDRVGRYIAKRSALANPRPSAEKQRAMLEEALATLAGVTDGLSHLGLLNDALTKEERARYADALGKMNGKLVRVKITLRSEQS